MIQSPYKIDKFHSLSLGFRIDLLPVIEDVKKGSIISYRPNFWNFLRSVEQETGLQYERRKEWIFVFKDRDHYEKYLARRISLGIFLDYPACCVEKFENSKLDNNALKFWKEAAKGIENGTYQNILEYVFYVPCSIHCEKTLEMCHKLEKIFQQYDKLAGTYLKLTERGEIKRFLK